MNTEESQDQDRWDELVHVARDAGVTGEAGGGEEPVPSGFVHRVVMMRRGLWRFARTLLWRRWLLIAAGAAMVLFLVVYVAMKLNPPPVPAPQLPFPPAP